VGAEARKTAADPSERSREVERSQAAEVPPGAEQATPVPSRGVIAGRVVQSELGRLVVELPHWPGHEPGQFAMLTLDPSGTSTDPLLPRPMAVFGGDSASLEFRYKVVGRGTARMAELRPGDPVGVLGPLGRGFPVPDAPTTLVGGGTGIASLYELASRYPDRVRVLLGARSADELLARDAFERLKAPLRLVTEDGSAGDRGRVTDYLAPAAGERVYACGPTPMMRRAFEIAQAKGASCFVSLESPMACGVGICLGCAVPTDVGFRYVCTHGPVFRADQLEWQGIP